MHDGKCCKMVSKQKNMHYFYVFSCRFLFFSLPDNLFLKVYKYVVLQPSLVKGTKCTRGGTMIWEISMQQTKQTNYLP